MTILFRALLSVLLLTSFANHVFAQSGTKKKRHKKSMTESASSNGRGYSIAGSILTPIAASLGGTLLVFGVLGSGSCDSTYESDSSKRNCERSKTNTYAGAAILTLGMGSGIYLTAKGRRMRRAMESSDKGSARPSEVAINTAWSF